MTTSWYNKSKNRHLDPTKDHISKYYEVHQKTE